MTYYYVFSLIDDLHHLVSIEAPSHVYQGLYLFERFNSRGQLVIL